MNIRYFKLHGGCLFQSVDGDYYIWLTNGGPGYKVDSQDKLKAAKSINSKYELMRFLLGILILIPLLIPSNIITKTVITYNQELISKYMCLFSIWMLLALILEIASKLIFRKIKLIKLTKLTLSPQTIDKPRPDKENTPPFFGYEKPKASRSEENFHVYSLFLGIFFLGLLYYGLSTLGKPPYLDAPISLFYAFLFYYLIRNSHQILKLDIPTPPLDKSNEREKNKEEKKGLAWWDWSLKRVLGIFIPFLIKSPNGWNDAIYFYGIVAGFGIAEAITTFETKRISPKLIIQRFEECCLMNENVATSKTSLTRWESPIKIYISSKIRDHSGQIKHLAKIYRSTTGANISTTPKEKDANLLIIEEENAIQSKTPGSFIESWYNNSDNNGWLTKTRCGFSVESIRQNNPDMYVTGDWEKARRHMVHYCLLRGLGMTGRFYLKERVGFKSGERTFSPRILAAMLHDPRLHAGMPIDRARYIAESMAHEISQSDSLENWLESQGRQFPKK